MEQQYENLSYTLSPALDQDVESVYKLYEVTLRPVIDEAIGWVDSQQRERFDKNYTIHKFQIITVKGSFAGALYATSKSDHLHLSLILIHAQFRNRSLGTKILEDIHSN